MEVKFHFRHLDHSHALKEFTASRLNFIMHKYAFKNPKIKAEVWFDCLQNELKTSMRIRLPKRYLHLQESGEDMYLLVNKVVQKLDTLVRKIKDKEDSKQRKRSLSQKIRYQKKNLFSVRDVA